VQTRIDFLLENPEEIQPVEASMSSYGVMSYSQKLRQNLLNRDSVLEPGEIDRLQKRTLTEQNLRGSGNGQSDCVICTGRYGVGEVMIDLPCFHYFHDVCIESWLRQSPTCPICRSGVRRHLGV